MYYYNAVDFTVTDIGGNEHNLYSYLDDGKYVVLNFFRDTDSMGNCVSDTCSNGMNNGNGCNGQNMNNNNDSCGLGCNGQIVDTLNKVYKSYGDNADELIVLAINAGGTDASVSVYVQKYGVSYPVASDKEGGGDAVVKAYKGMMGHNHTLLIAPDKKIVESMLHVHDMLETIKKYVQPLILNGSTAIQSSDLNSSLWSDISVESFTNQNIVLSLPMLEKPGDIHQSGASGGHRDSRHNA